MRLGHGLRRSLICFAPRAFVSQRQEKPKKVPTPLVFLAISTHFTASPQVPLPSASLKLTHLVHDAEVGPRHFTYDAISRLHDSLRPVNPDNACTPRITATAGTWFVGAYSSRLDCGIKEVYNPKAFFPHAVSLGQAFAHCRIFPVAAVRRRMARVSVPLWGVVLSHPLPVVALVGFYPTN